MEQPQMPKSGWKRLVPRFLAVVKVALLVALAGAVVYWLKFVPVAVERHAVSAGEVVVEVMGTGTLDAHTKAVVSTKIPGRLATVEVDQGDLVVAGQVLARLDDQDLKREVEIEEANVAARMAGVVRLQADVLHARANLDLADAVEKRRQKLLAAKSIPQEEYDQAVEGLAVARAGQSRADAAVIEGLKQQAAAEKMLEFRKARLQDAVIRAPFDGVVTRRDRNAGDVVVPGSSILSLVSTVEMWVGAWVDETQVARLKPGQPARVVFRSEPDQPVAGKVVRLGRETDRETRETPVDVAPEKLPTNWSVGQRAEVYIEAARKQADVVVPVRFLFWRNGQSGVFVDVDGRARWQLVTLGMQGAEVAEITEGLSSGDVVVAPTGSTPLADGQRVGP
ncbi:MAG: efflux RND transporter periplasmic adaptor subunit [Planctomycetota bacterium]